MPVNFDPLVPVVTLRVLRRQKGTIKYVIEPFQFPNHGLPDSFIRPFQSDF